MNKIVEDFNRYYFEYELWFEKNEFAYKSELNLIKSMIPDYENGIEIGVGTGLFSEPFGIKFGVDPSFSMMRLAKDRGIRVIKGVAEKLPLKSNIFDLVIFVTAICFVKNPFKALVDINRILKMNTNIIVGFVNPYSKIGRMYKWKKNKSKFYKNAFFYDYYEVEKLLIMSGFELELVRQTLFSELKDINDVDEIRDGHRDGAFISILARKSKSS